MDNKEITIHRYLVKKSIEGDREAQSEVYRLYAGAMYNICRRMMGEEEEAKDVLQEAFINAFQKIKNLKEADTFSAWLKRIVVNFCLNAIKKKKLLSTDIDDGYDIGEEEEEDYDYRRHQKERVMEALDKISEGCRTVLNLYVFEGYDHKEIAEILEISESASKAQYSKAKSKIRKILELENFNMA